MLNQVANEFPLVREIGGRTNLIFPLFPLPGCKHPVTLPMGSSSLMIFPHPVLEYYWHFVSLLRKNISTASWFRRQSSLVLTVGRRTPYYGYGFLAPLLKSLIYLRGLKLLRSCLPWPSTCHNSSPCPTTIFSAGSSIGRFVRFD